MAYYNGKDMYYFTNKCSKVYKYFICKNSISTKNNIQTGCLEYIFTLKTANCKAKDVEIQEVITKIEPAHILILNTINSTVESNCTTNISIKGSALITFNNCEVYINRFPYDKDLLQF